MPRLLSVAVRESSSRSEIEPFPSGRRITRARPSRRAVPKHYGWEEWGFHLSLGFTPRQPRTGKLAARLSTST